jgi:hypothetical protein
MLFSLLASTDAIESQTTDGYSSLDLSNVTYNLCIYSRDEMVKVMLRTKLNSLTQREKNMIDEVMKMEISIRKYSQLSNRADPGYGGLAKFIVIDQYVGFPGEGC